MLLKHWLIPNVSIGLTTFALTQILLLVSYRCANASSLPWQKAASVAPDGLLEQLFKENFSQSRTQFNPRKMGIMKISGQKYPLYVIDPKSNSLCGAAGCAYFGYVPRFNRYQQVFNIYLNPSLPANIPLIKADSKVTNGLPCLIFSQVQNAHLQVIRWCYNGQKYTHVP